MTRDAISSRPAFQAGTEIHVWSIPLTGCGDAVECRFQTLSADERCQANRFAFPRDRARYITAHHAMRCILSPYVGLSAAAIGFTRTAFGKPFIPGAAIQFNLTHSGRVALVAVTSGREVGVDLEQDSPRDAMELAERFFSPAEISALRRLPPAERSTAFTRCWSRKEAYLKALGRGLSLELDGFSVPHAPECRGHPMTAGDGTRWTLEALNMYQYPAAIVYRGEACALQTFEFATIGEAVNDGDGTRQRFEGFVPQCRVRR